MWDVILPIDFHSYFSDGEIAPPSRWLLTIINHIITININHYQQYINHILTIYYDFFYVNWEVNELDIVHFPLRKL